jgi:hypothetical protein
MLKSSSSMQFRIARCGRPTFRVIQRADLGAEVLPTYVPLDGQ